MQGHNCTNASGFRAQIFLFLKVWPCINACTNASRKHGKPRKPQVSHACPIVGNAKMHGLRLHKCMVFHTHGNAFMHACLLVWGGCWGGDAAGYGDRGFELVDNDCLNVSLGVEGSALESLGSRPEGDRI